MFIEDFERTFWTTAILGVVATAIVYMVFFSAVMQIGNQVQKEGGLGNVIGRFVQDIQNPEPLPQEVK